MKAFITVDLGFGDAGKGSIVDALVRRYAADVVVRFNGGSQAAHSVYNDAGVHHSFSQMGSGTFVKDTYTFLSRYMLVNPLVMMAENSVLFSKGVNDALSRVFIDGRAIMVTPYHRAVNRLRELARGDARHGSCGAGIGETMADSIAFPACHITMGDFHNLPLFVAKLSAIKERMLRIVNGLPKLPDNEEVDKQLSTFQIHWDRVYDRYKEFYLATGPRILDEYAAVRFLSSAKVAVFEAAQGVLLDENFGFHPYTTWSTTTTKNAKLILEEAEITEKPTTIGITRTYMTRHGAGPFPTESQDWTRRLMDKNNPWNQWQSNLRCGPLDLNLLNYALKANGPVDCLAVTHMDAVADTWEVCTEYDKVILPPQKTLELQEHYVTKRLDNLKLFWHPVPKKMLLPFMAEYLRTPIGITSDGPTHKDKQFHGILENVAV